VEEALKYHRQHLAYISPISPLYLA
jgi:hypothetical protein